MTTPVEKGNVDAFERELKQVFERILEGIKLPETLPVIVDTPQSPQDNSSQTQERVKKKKGDKHEQKN